ncbi:glycosyltransferase [Acidisphaera sp. L21]|uniref:glycosyltransferase n=1 Tax=Acidisphaera sp. L21 TaxID=1641851 RepID=UPI00131B8BA3|nr:glycosyltransferase [Acidisphaera sp. L21]
MIAIALLALATWVYLLAWHGRFWSAGPILAPAIPTDAPALDIVVPARDEAESIERCLRSLLGQAYPGTLRIFLVDDRSSDGTGAIARSLADPRLVVIDGAPRPDGWSGKLWAVAQGVRRGDAPVVLLCDADIVHDPAHVATLVAKLESAKLDQVSEMVELNCTSFAERALVPAFVFFFQLLYPFARVNDPANSTAAAAGGTILIRRAALERIGGIEAVRGKLIDDVALATAVKQGGHIWLGHSQLARSIRPYPEAVDVWRMVARTAYVQLRFSPLILLGTIVGLALVWLAPPLLAIFGHGPTRWAGLAAWVGSAASYVPTLLRFRQSVLWALALPLVAAFYMAATIGSAIDHHRGRGVVWKNRAYGEAGT